MRRETGKGGDALTTELTTETHPASRSTPFDIAESQRRCRRMRRRVLEMSQTVPAIHIGGSFSCLEVLDTIYSGLMRRGPKIEYPDTFILSKGHGAVAQYVMLEEIGILTRADMDLYCLPGGRLGIHPDYGTPGIEASTGALGHGLGLAVGMALADKVLRHARTVYVVMSDGEMQEGSVWEALMQASSLKLPGVVGFVDLNDFQSLGRTSELHPSFYPVADKVRAFGWEAVEVDGHDQQAIFDAVKARDGIRPLLVIARTTKGKGVSYMENVPIWHYRSPNPDEYRQALLELAEDGE